MSIIVSFYLPISAMMLVLSYLYNQFEIFFSKFLFCTITNFTVWKLMNIQCLVWMTVIIRKDWVRLGHCTVSLKRHLFCVPYDMPITFWWLMPNINCEYNIVNFYFLKFLVGSKQWFFLDNGWKPTLKSDTFSKN